MSGQIGQEIVTFVSMSGMGYIGYCMFQLLQMEE